MGLANRRLKLLIGFAVWGIALAAAAPAQAVPTPAGDQPCDVDLTDAGGYLWDANEESVVGSGGNSSGGGGDTFDQYADFAVRVGSSTSNYANEDDDVCGREAGGREIVYPEIDLEGLRVSRKLYVPEGGTAFARFVHVVRNTGSEPITADLLFQCDDDYDSDDCPEDEEDDDNSSPLGSDSSTQVGPTSSGDEIADADDRWATSDDSDEEGGDNAIGHNWDQESGARDQADSVYLKDEQSALQVVWENVTIGPGETVVYMFVASQRVSFTDAPVATDHLGDGPTEVFAELSTGECDELRNWACSRPADAPAPAAQAPAALPADTERPRVSLAGVRRACVSRSFRTRVKVNDSSPLRTVRVYLDGRRIRTTTRADFVQTVAARRLRSGRHALRIVAIDTAGNRTQIRRRFTRCARQAQRPRARRRPSFTG